MLLTSAIGGPDSAVDSSRTAGQESYLRWVVFANGRELIAHGR